MAETSIPYVIPLNNQKPKVFTLVPSDPTSRYKTRQLQVQVVGKSKMIKTVLVNILEVAKDMQVPPPWIGTYCAYEIGAQAKFDAKKAERQQAFISGEHDTKDLSKIVVQFIEEVVLCPRCGLPELLIHVEAGKVLGKCRACGGDEELRISNEKFKRFVINHPPSQHQTQKGGAFAGNTQQTTKDNKDGKNKEKEKESKEKEKKEMKTKPKSEKQSLDEGDDEDDVVWYSDTSDEAARQRREAMLPKSMDSVIPVDKSSAAKKLSSNDLENLISGPDDEVVEKLKKLKMSHAVGDLEFSKLLFNASFTANMTADLKKLQSILSKFIVDEPSQIAFLTSFENFSEKVDTSLLPKSLHIIKSFYDEDILEEDSIFTWFDSTSPNSLIRKHVEPLVKWLKEAEEESEEDEN